MPAGKDVLGIPRSMPAGRKRENRDTELSTSVSLCRISEANPLLLNFTVEQGAGKEHFTSASPGASISFAIKDDNDSALSELLEHVKPEHCAQHMTGVLITVSPKPSKVTDSLQ